MSIVEQRSGVPGPGEPPVKAAESSMGGPHQHHTVSAATPGLGMRACRRRRRAAATREREAHASCSSRRGW
eukprot:6256026-Prymnesium_polylepis.1